MSKHASNQRNSHRSTTDHFDLHYQGPTTDTRYKALELIPGLNVGGFFDAGDSSANFFYTWSELTYSPLEWLRAGLAIQRTKAYKTELDLQRGFLVGVAYKKVDLTGYVFNAGWTDPTFVLAVGFNF